MSAIVKPLGGLFVAAALLAAAPVQAAREGVYWEVASEMEGMPFPMPKQKVCAPKGSKEPPVSKDDGECKVLDKRMSGSRYYWKAQCKEGLMEGDFTYSTDSYSGTMKITRDGETMKMKLSGRNLREACTDDSDARLAAAKAAGAKAQADADNAMAQAEAAKAQSCAEALDKMTGMVIIDMKSCPKQVAAYCKNLATPAGYQKAWLADGRDSDGANPNGFFAHAKACKLDAKTLPAKLCPTALKQEEIGFIADHCPAEKQVMLRKYCEGRKSTSEIDPKYQGFCAGNYGVSAAPVEKPALPKPAMPQAGGENGAMPNTDALIDGAKKLKGLLGF